MKLILCGSITFHLQDITATLPIHQEFINFETTRAFSQKYNLSEKEKFHLTIIGRKTGEDILEYLQAINPKEKEIKLLQIQKLCESYHPKLECKQEFYYIKKEYSEIDIRESVIQIVNIDGLEEFYEKLFEIIPIRFDIPFSHVTLYTTSTQADKKLRGIGIYSLKEFSDIKPLKI